MISERNGYDLFREKWRNELNGLKQLYSVKYYFPSEQITRFENEATKIDKNILLYTTTRPYLYLEITRGLKNLNDHISAAHGQKHEHRLCQSEPLKKKREQSFTKPAVTSHSEPTKTNSRPKQWNFGKCFLSLFCCWGARPSKKTQKQKAGADIEVSTLKPK